MTEELAAASVARRLVRRGVSFPIAAYMRVPSTRVIRRLDQLQNWGLIDRRGGTITRTKRRSILSSACEATIICSFWMLILQDWNRPFWTLCRIER